MTNISVVEADNKRIKVTVRTTMIRMRYVTFPPMNLPEFQQVPLYPTTGASQTGGMTQAGITEALDERTSWKERQL